MRPEIKQRLKKVTAWLATTAVLLFLLPFLTQVVGLGLGIALALILVLGYLIFLIGIPFFIWIMAESMYRVLFKPYVRAWHINHIRNSRLLREASARRGNSE
jgi:uncharacterized membrane protein